MADLLPHLYYLADLLLAVCFPALAWRLAGPRRPTWRLFWLGAAIGLSWEIPIFALSAWTGSPILEWLTPLPLPPLVFIVAHSLWDGALLTGGWLLAQRLTARPTSGAGIGVQLAWGQMTELCVELSAILAGTWVYLDGLWFNPPLAHVRGHPLPLLLQLIWLLAPLAFVGLASALRITAEPGDRDDR